MKKFKLMILSAIFLATQLNSLKVKFPDDINIIDISDEYGTIFIPEAEVQRLNSLHESVTLNLLKTDYEKTKDTLLKARRYQELIIHRRISELEATKDLFRYFIPTKDFMISLRVANNYLQIPILYEAIQKFETICQLRIDKNGISRSDIQYLNGEKHIPTLKNQSSLSRLNTLDFASFLIEIGDVIIPITPEAFDLAKNLMHHRKNYHEYQTIKLESINPDISEKLIQLWESAAKIDSIENSEDIDTAMLATKKEEFNLLIRELTIKDLDLLIDAVYKLNIQPLFKTLSLEFYKKLQEAEAFDLLITHPEKFQFDSADHLLITDHRINTQMYLVSPQIRFIDKPDFPYSVTVLNLGFENIIFISACKREQPKNITNPILNRIFNGLHPLIQQYLRKNHLIIEH